MKNTFVDIGQNQPGSSLVTDASQYLTFIMNEEEYGVDILCVQEIRGWEAATPLPNAPKQIKGVINLRGTIVPVIDLRQCFGLPALEYTAVTVVIVLKIHNEGNVRVVGIAVDGVSDVYSLSQKDLRQAPDLGHAVDMHFVKGIASIEKKMVILLDIDYLLNLNEVPNLSGLTV